MNKSSFDNINPLSHYSVHELLCDSADNQHEKSDVIQNDEKKTSTQILWNYRCANNWNRLAVRLRDTYKHIHNIQSGKETECIQEAQEWSAYRSVDLFNNKQYTSVSLLVLLLTLYILREHYVRMLSSSMAKACSTIRKLFGLFRLFWVKMCTGQGTRPLRQPHNLKQEAKETAWKHLPFNTAGVLFFFLLHNFVGCACGFLWLATQRWEVWQRLGGRT